jgi:large subunit ribosomal protein L9
MDVILLERVEKLGIMGQIVSVKNGFARNFLLPGKKAVRATKDALAAFEAQKTQLEADNLKFRKEAEAVAVRMTGLSVDLIRQAGASGHLFGSASSRDIADAIVAKGFTVNRSQVVLDQPIKMLGTHPARVRLHPEVSVNITVNVAQTEEEAQALANAGKKAEKVEAVAEETAETIEA